MKKHVAIAVLGAIAGAASGCQTPEQSSMQASNVCMASGLHPGTHAYQRCYAANYTNLRANSQQAENAAVAGAALGVAGGALAGAAIANSTAIIMAAMVRAGAMVGVRAAAGAAAGKAGAASRPKASGPERALKRRPSGWSRSGSSGGRPRWVDPIWVSLIRALSLWNPSIQGLEKLGFPWILSCEMSFFNGLRGIFREKNSRAPVPRRAAERGKRSAGTGGSAAHVERIDHGASLALLLVFCNKLSRDTLLQKLWLQTSAAAVRFRPARQSAALGRPPIAQSPERGDDGKDRLPPAARDQLIRLVARERVGFRRRREQFTEGLNGRA